MPLPDPMGWSALQFGDETSWLDFLGANALTHRALDVHLRENLLVAPYPTLPLGDGGDAGWDEAHQMSHAGEAQALGLTPAIDFRFYDREKPEEFATYVFLHAQEHLRLQNAAGI